MFTLRSKECVGVGYVTGINTSSHKTSSCCHVAPKSWSPNPEDPFFLPYLIASWQQFISEVTCLKLNMYPTSYLFLSPEPLLAPYYQLDRISRFNMALEALHVLAPTSLPGLISPCCFCILCSSHTSLLAIPRACINFHASVLLFSLVSF